MNKARRKEICELIERIEQLKSDVENVLNDEQEYYDNMPENLLYSERGEMSSKAITNLESAVDSLDEVIKYLQEVTY